ncbi:MAG: LamG-like jellyroll fold domain-containing protein, partial [Sarcina sp.]
IDHYKYWIEQQARDSSTQSKWLSDAIHPNANGHLVMAKKIFEYFDLIDSNSYTSNMNYPINISKDLGRYVDTIGYPKYTDMINATALISYKINRQFMGNEYIEKNEDLNKIKGLTKGTIVARFNLTTAEIAKTILSISDSKVDASNATLAINSGAVHFSVRNNGVVTTNITTSKTGYNDGNWHTVIINVDTTGTKIYIDGTNIHTDTAKGFFSLVSSADTVSIGRNLDFKTMGEWYYKGAIAYIDIYNNNLTEEQSISRSNENMLSNLNDISNIIASNEAGPWIFIGDNVTAGKGTTYGHRNYVEHVEERIRWEMNNSIMTRREKFMINMASKDATSVDILSNFNNLIAKFNPKVVFIMIGGNEKISAIDFKNNLTNIISKIK